MVVVVVVVIVVVVVVAWNLLPRRRYGYPGYARCPLAERRLEDMSSQMPRPSGGSMVVSAGAAHPMMSSASSRSVLASQPGMSPLLSRNRSTLPSSGSPFQNNVFLPGGMRFSPAPGQSASMMPGQFQYYTQPGASPGVPRSATPLVGPAVAQQPAAAQVYHRPVSPSRATVQLGDPNPNFRRSVDSSTFRMASMQPMTSMTSMTPMQPVMAPSDNKALTNHNLGLLNGFGAKAPTQE
ncbi:unnamed protein product, partial [Polarella glacialis]